MVLNVLVNCEESGTVRDAFLKLGHNAWSCDLLPSRVTGPHLHIDARDAIGFQKWDLMIAHPPCTYLANSGAKHLYIGMKKENGRNEERWEKMREAAVFFRELLTAPIPFIAVENPIMLGYAVEIIGATYDQLVQPWQFGHGECKATCFWLKGLPKLEPTNIVDGRKKRVHMMPDSKGRQQKRSVTYSGIALAMAQQWGQYVSMEIEGELK